MTHQIAIITPLTQILNHNAILSKRSSSHATKVNNQNCQTLYNYTGIRQHQKLFAEPIAEQNTTQDWKFCWEEIQPDICTPKTNYISLLNLH